MTLKELFHKLKDHPCYLSLSSDHARLTLRKVIQAYNSYFALRKLKKKGEYDEQVRSPRFLTKDGHFQVEFIQRQIKREGKFLRLSFGRRGIQSLGGQYLHVRIPDNLLGHPIRGVRIIPKFNDYFEIEFLYVPEETITDLDFDQHLSLDLGLDNLVAAVSTRETAFILEGRGFISYNQWWNKQAAKLKSQYDRQGIRMGKKLKSLQIKRYNIVRNLVHHLSRYVVVHCLSNMIGNIVIGEWDDMKRRLRMGRRISQQFQQFPYRMLKKSIEYKAGLYGINVHFVDETYTSQRCSSCGTIRKSNRVHRGLYRCRKCGTEWNADINGAINILKKVVPKGKSRWDSCEIVSPSSLKLVCFSG